MTPVKVTRGDSPLVLGQPHTGTFVPDDIAARLNETGRALADTDWFIDRLYDGLAPGCTTVKATFHRYVIDANRDPAGVSLYPGQNTTGLVPITDFDGHPIWTQEPTPEDIEARRATYHAPYHAALAAELDRVRQLHGFAVLYDCHSIRSEIPFLFHGLLPVFNIGTNDGQTCAPALADLVQPPAQDTVRNARFKGGWTTRHYGLPDQNIHAIQMELAQRAYLSAETPPWTYDPDKAGHLRAILGPILHALTDWRPA